MLAMAIAPASHVPSGSSRLYGVRCDAKAPPLASGMAFARVKFGASVRKPVARVAYGTGFVDLRQHADGNCHDRMLRYRVEMVW